MNYILRKQTGKPYKKKYTYFNGSVIDASDFSRYTTKNASEATILTEDETRSYSAKINAGAFIRVKVD